MSGQNENKVFEKKQAKYLSDGINYGANTICKAAKGDLEQLAADSYFQGYNDARDLSTEFAEWLPWHGWHLIIITGTHIWKNMLGDHITTELLFERFIEEREK